MKDVDPKIVAKVQKLMGIKKYETFVKSLSKLANDKKVLALLSSGLLDGDENDEKFETSQRYVDVKLFTPTQKEIDVEKSLKFALAAKFPTTESMLKGQVEIVAPVVALDNGDGKLYILDGHHRWSQTYALNKDALISTLIFYKKGLNPQDMLKVLQIAIARDIQKVPIQKVEGINLLSISDKGVDKAVKEFISDKALDLMVKYNKIDSKDKDLAVKYILDNVSSMKKTSQPIKGASSRDFMPQTPEAINSLKLTKDGSTNFLDPLVKEQRVMRFDTFVNESYNK